jgi:RHS repeat-associated protein
MTWHSSVCNDLNSRGRPARTNYSFLTRKERDIETGLDYFGARYYASTQGRFTSTDPLMVTTARFMDPQQFNLYNYTRGNPLAFVDDDGRQTSRPSQNKPTVRIEPAKITRTTYDVTGSTANEAMGKAKKHDGFPAYTKGDFDTKWNGSFSTRRQRNGTYTTTVTVTEVSVQANINVDVPKWADAANAPESEQRQWNEMSAQIDAHENDHVAIAVQTATEMGNAMADASSPVQATGRTAREAEEKAKGAMQTQVSNATQRVNQEGIERQKKLDAETDHGRKKP